MPKKKFTFTCIRTVEQTLDVVIKAENEEIAEVLFNAQREETDDFDKGNWVDGDPTGPLDWEVEEG